MAVAGSSGRGVDAADRNRPEQQERKMDERLELNIYLSMVYLFVFLQIKESDRRSCCVSAAVTGGTEASLAAGRAVGHSISLPAGPSTVSVLFLP